MRAGGSKLAHMHKDSTDSLSSFMGKSINISRVHQAVHDTHVLESTKSNIYLIN